MNIDEVIGKRFYVDRIWENEALIGIRYTFKDDPNYFSFTMKNDKTVQELEQQALSDFVNWLVRLCVGCGAFE